MLTAPFDVRAPLPTGVTVLEASAGTGKTYTIAALAARYVADGIELDKLLLVTFTRMATGELRERVRERLIGAEQALARALGGGGLEDEDEVVRLLADGPRATVEQRRERLAKALAGFDAATIATTHGFCQEVLGGLGLAGDGDGGGTFLEDVEDLVDEVVDDLYVRRFHAAAGTPAFSRAEAGRIAAIAVANPGAPIEPQDAEGTPGMRARLAGAVRAELERRKRRMGVLTYDDLLTRLDAILAGPGGEAVARRLRDRWHVVLVDEFQDTDPVQWSIMRRAFGASTLVLIGDPKQAIYAFRGADVYAYLEAAREAGAQATLDVNWRSDQGLLDAYDGLFGGARLGHEGIVYRTVRAAAGRRRAELPGAPLRIRVLAREDVKRTPGGYASAPAAREFIARDLAADLVSLLSSGGSLPDGSALRPGHVAVLVRTNRNAAQVRDALDAVGVPAVINGAGSVFGTRAALEWLRLLEAIERPTSTARARAAALTPFLGWSAERVATAEDGAWEDVHRRLHGWARALRVQGVASLAETITLVESLPERVLAAPDGERRLTDMRHVAQLLHAAAVSEQLGTTALAGWLRRRIAEAAQDTGDEDRSRRLESDAEAVQVLTIHRSKGLEFGVVYCPDLWEPTWITEESVPVAYHDPSQDDRRVLDVGLDGPGYREHKRLALIEQRGEDLRLAYVALTRARHRAVVWWAGSSTSRHSALGRLVFAREQDGTVAWAGRSAVSDAAATARFEALAASAPGCFAVERAALGLPRTWSGPLRDVSALAAARFERRLDPSWRRTSFSDITAGAYESRVASEPEETVVADEPEAAVVALAPAGDDALRATRSLLGEMPVGTEVGTFVHRVLEATDFAAADLDAELGERVAAIQARRPAEIGDPVAAIAGLRAALETPLGPLLGGARLRDLDRSDRLDELDFELPLAGGDRPTGHVALDAIAAVLRAELPPGDPLAGYADRLADPVLRRSVRGYLTGSIDLVARVGERFAVVDYKTNRLAAPGEPLTAWHHRPELLAAEMERAHYALQALLYTVALHRFLRWRLAGYDPQRNLAGVLYLFLRGMTGPATPVVDGVPCGVFAWRPPAALVLALSDVLDEGRAR
ncbi:MAG: exodeoxyribonuclease beta subunit [Solirubrobacteraceae bacterium]|nr:exodeoxyribonuclease beta subunit [Solirubrobacteraceae bacterium]